MKVRQGAQVALALGTLLSCVSYCEAFAIVPTLCRLPHAAGSNWARNSNPRAGMTQVSLCTSMKSSSEKVDKVLQELRALLDSMSMQAEAKVIIEEDTPLIPLLRSSEKTSDGFGRQVAIAAVSTDNKLRAEREIEAVVQRAEKTFADLVTTEREMREGGSSLLEAARVLKRDRLVEEIQQCQKTILALQAELQDADKKMIGTGVAVTLETPVIAEGTKLQALHEGASTALEDVRDQVDAAHLAYEKIKKRQAEKRAKMYERLGAGKEEDAKVLMKVAQETQAGPEQQAWSTFDEL